mmetsp:Transcript_21146/g.30578  ORF Transcript_21146/g.30578 Transcript_21146/m.30578 type:complete len:339 (+) Transcript_21146:56-1072(+)
MSLDWNQDISTHASALCQAIRAWQHKNPDAWEFDWDQISTIMNDNGLKLYPLNCSALWNYIAYGESPGKDSTTEPGACSVSEQSSRKRLHNEMRDLRQDEGPPTEAVTPVASFSGRYSVCGMSQVDCTGGNYGSSSKNSSSRPQQQGKEYKFHCTTCGKGLSSKTSLKSHLKKLHNIDEIPPFPSIMRTLPDKPLVTRGPLVTRALPANKLLSKPQPGQPKVSNVAPLQITEKAEDKLPTMPSGGKDGKQESETSIEVKVENPTNDSADSTDGPIAKISAVSSSAHSISPANNRNVDQAIVVRTGNERAAENKTIQPSTIEVELGTKFDSAADSESCH